ncbi:aromatic amino acid transaminase [Paraburkholderia sp. EG285A]|uniref:aromatic amino acid transaminase n=1 Tax=Paraburkholderia sp. EG285A TaxID=3237009 RepID=UPI0034D1EB9C
MLEIVEPYEGDPILSLNDAFNRDPREGRVNLSVGVYFDDAGRIPVMEAVRHAETTRLGTIGPRPYQPLEGALNYRAAVQVLVFGAAHEAVESRRIATAQTLGGSGALRLGADFLHRYFPKSGVWISNPSWENHRAIFEAAGFPVQTYPYFDAATGGLDFDGMMGTLCELAPESIVVLHACCHNPTGVDLTREQWAKVFAVVAERRLIPFIDMAYQGFGAGLDDDAWAVRTLADTRQGGRPMPMFVANSFSKNFSLYGERCGALSVVCADEDQAQRVTGQLASTVRRIYSGPPTHGGQVIASVLNSNELRAEWQAELDAMRGRIKRMRSELHDGLQKELHKRGAEDRAANLLSSLIEQRGMFSYTGLSAQQVDTLRDEYAVYLVRSGRLCVAGLNDGNVGRVAVAMANVVTAQLS